MKRELLTCIMHDEQMRREFAFVVDHMNRIGQTTCGILFGYAWGNDYYPGDRWDFETIPTDSVVTKVEEVESRGIGKLGSNDLFLEFPGWTFRFCNNSDIHMVFAEDSPVVEFYRSRWERLGLRPAIWPSREPDTNQGDAATETEEEQGETQPGTT